MLARERGRWLLRAGPECKGVGPRRKKEERAAVEVSGPNWISCWSGLGFLKGLGFGFWVFFLFLFLFLSNSNSNSNSRQMNSNLNLNSHKHSTNKTMLQHDATTKIKPMINFNYLRIKIRLNARLTQ